MDYKPDTNTSWGVAGLGITNILIGILVIFAAIVNIVLAVRINNNEVRNEDQRGQARNWVIAAAIANGIAAVLLIISFFSGYSAAKSYRTKHDAVVADYYARTGMYPQPQVPVRPPPPRPTTVTLSQGGVPV